MMRVDILIKGRSKAVLKNGFSCFESKFSKAVNNLIAYMLSVH
jgi:hypothetical protein